MSFAAIIRKVTNKHTVFRQSWQPHLRGAVDPTGQRSYVKEVYVPNLNSSHSLKKTDLASLWKTNLMGRVYWEKVYREKNIEIVNRGKVLRKARNTSCYGSVIP